MRADKIEKRTHGLRAKAAMLKKSVSGSGEVFTRRAERVVEIIFDRGSADKKTKARKVSAETLRMIKEMRTRLTKGISGRDLLWDAAYGIGKISTLTKRAYRSVSNYFKG